MKKILIISTGGTFNKDYNPLNGELEIDKNASAVTNIASKWLCELEVITLINKDSLNMTNDDRKLLVDTIQGTNTKHIIVIHGTDTIDITAIYLDKHISNKYIVLTGAMVPYSIDAIEATANLCSAYGYLSALEKQGIHIAINGSIGSYEEIKKDRVAGKFILNTEL